jgi:hypothetical protein
VAAANAPDSRLSETTSIETRSLPLAAVFRRAVRDLIITFNPCEEPELRKVVAKHARALTPIKYWRLVHAVPEPHRLMIQTVIATVHRPAARQAQWLRHWREKARR